jgi:hypothetical protein
MSDHPIEGQILLLAGSRASVPVNRLPDLVERAQSYVREHREEYARSYERIEGAREADYFCVEMGYWDRVGGELALDDRETDAVQRAHSDQFMRDGRRLDREREFETTLDVREVVTVVSTY